MTRSKLNKLEEFYVNHYKAFEFALWHIRTKGYTEKTITKKNGNLRNLLVPPLFTKNMQKKIKNIINEYYRPTSAIHGFIISKDDDTRNIVSNAKVHVKKRIVINLDIENFFDTINFGRVRGLFLSKPFSLNNKIATRIAQLTTYDNKLPQGAPTSPLISNIICNKMDHHLIKVAKSNGYTFTRYADDITFSTNKRIYPSDIENIILEIKNVINNNGFNINESKTRVQDKYESQVVTGLKVNEKVNINRKFIRVIRSMLFSWFRDGLDVASENHFKTHTNQNVKYITDKSQSFQNILIGKIAFLGLVKGKNDANYIKFRHQFFLLRDNFFLSTKKDRNIEYEFLDINHLKRENIIKYFTQIFDSILVFTEGVTDIVYIKEALKYYQKKGEFTDLKLRFCDLNGWSNVKTIHQAIYADRLDKYIFGLNVKKCITPHLDKRLKMVFVPDSDESKVVNYFKNQPIQNYYLLDEKNKGYVEKLLDKNVIIEILTSEGYDIDPNKSKDKKIKKSLQEHLDKNKDKDEIFSISSYIVYKSKLINKTMLAKKFSERDDVKYDNFKELFEFIETMKFNDIEIKQSCCTSLY
jgi:RNA-directed DNA polymerase